MPKTEKTITGIATTMVELAAITLIEKDMYLKAQLENVY
jgi:hypothetical protein